MPLTDSEKQTLRQEEEFRAEVRKEISERAKAPRTFFDKLAGFFDTKAGFWILTTVLAGAFATGITELQQHQHRDELKKREAAEGARRDTDYVIKLGPMLTSGNEAQKGVALVLLDGLSTREAVDPNTATQVRQLIERAASAGAKPNATPEEQSQSAVVVTYADRERLAAIQKGGPDTVPSKNPELPTPPAIPDAALPLRIYLQISNESDRPAAQAARDAFRKSGIVVPGIELVPVTSSPVKANIRYCEGKVESGSAERLKDIAASVLTEAPRLLVLNPSLCTRVRSNHFELWFARKA